MISFVTGLLAAFLVARAIVTRTQGRDRVALHVVGALAAIGVAILAAGSVIVLGKIVARMLMPIGLVWSAGWIACVIALARRQARHALMGAALGVAMTLTGSETFGQALMSILERDYQNDPYQGPPLDVVFVLGGGVDPSPHDSYELGPSGDRVLLGARLYLRGRAKMLVASGTTIEGLGVPFDNVGGTHRIWRDLGVPDDAIGTLTGETRNTREEAQAAAAFVRAHNFASVGLVTSAWHMNRARKTFEAEGLTVVPLAADHRGGPKWDGLASIVPTANGAFHVGKACWEFLGAL